MRTDVLGLGYLVFEVSDEGAWRRLLVDVVGCTEGCALDGGGRSYRLDERSARIFVLPGAADDLVALGFESASRDAMWDVAMRARDAQAFVEEGLEADAAARFVDGLIRFDEPGELTIEIFHGAHVTDAPLDRTRNRGGFVTGMQGLGHVALRANDVAQSQAFFEHVLGFKLSDHIRCQLTGGFDVDITFLHVNRRHHTLALGEKLPKHLHHFMLQVESLDDLGCIYDRCFDLGVRVVQSLGRHPNDRMMSFYAKTPSGFEIECGYGGREIDDATWVPQAYDRISLWGHRSPSSMKNIHV
jgi:2,3-dihydroxybiphenyl 1,2-dioxygenase